MNEVVRRGQAGMLRGAANRVVNSLHIHIFLEPEKVPNQLFEVEPNGRLKPKS